jgi:hypothetical protein
MRFSPPLFPASRHILHTNRNCYDEETIRCRLPSLSGTVAVSSPVVTEIQSCAFIEPFPIRGKAFNV